MTRSLAALIALCLLCACESTYYSAWEKAGVYKRDILVDRIEDAQDAQQDAQEEFTDALEQFQLVVGFDGGDLKAMYEDLNDAYEDSLAAANTITARVDSVENVAEDLFDEWEEELAQYSSASLKRDSQRKLQKTRDQYRKLMSAMRQSEKSMQPVLATLRDQTLYLKHNLNANAIASLKGEYKSIKVDVERLIADMQRSIDKSAHFIAQIEKG